MRGQLLLPGSEQGLLNWKGCDKFGYRVLIEYFGIGKIGVADEDIYLMAADALV